MDLTLFVAAALGAMLAQFPKKPPHWLATSDHGGRYGCFVVRADSAEEAEGIARRQLPWAMAQPSVSVQLAEEVKPEQEKQTP